MAAAVLPLPPRPVGSVHSVNVLLPLLRHSTFDALARLKRRAGQQQIQIAVVVVIHKRNPRRPIARRQSSLSCHILKLALPRLRNSSTASSSATARSFNPSPSKSPTAQATAWPWPSAPRAAASTSSKLPSPCCLQHANRLRAVLHQHQVHPPCAGHVHHARPAGRR